MNTVLIALHLVACQPDLLICKDLTASQVHWQDMEACEDGRATQMRQAKETLPDWAIVMSRCRYLVGRDQRSVPIF